MRMPRWGGGRFPGFVGVCALLMAAGTGGAFAQVPTSASEVLYPWAYSAVYGTGTYTFGAERVYVFKIEPKVPLPKWKPRGGSATVRLPFTVGLREFELGDIGGLDDLFDSVRTVTFVPGLEVEIPIKGSWSLKPHAHFGGGISDQDEDSAWIHYFGVTSRVGLTNLGGMEIAMINGLEFFGQNPSNGESDGFTALITGFEGDYCMGTMSLFGRPLFFKPHIAHYWYFDAIALDRPFAPKTELRQEFEVALAVGFEERISFKVWGFDRMGFAYRDGNGVTGFRIFFSSVFL